MIKQVIEPGKYINVFSHEFDKMIELKNRIVSWCENIDLLTLEQLINLTQLPLESNVNVMADCLSEDTEILTNSGFKKIINLSECDLIANIDIEDNLVFFEKPKKIIIRDIKNNEKMFEFKIKHLNKSIITSEKHRMSYIDKLGLISSKIPEITYIKNYVWSGKGLKNNVSINLTNDELRLLIWIIGDGNITITDNKSSINKRIRFGLRKKRKIDRLLSILNNIGIKYTMPKNNKQTSIYLSTDCSRKYIEIVSDYKNLLIEFIVNVNKEQADVLIYEAIMVDGDYENFIKHGTIRLNSTNKKFIDTISAISSINGYINNCNFRKTKLGNRELSIYYCSIIPTDRCIFSKNGFHNNKVIKHELYDYNKKVVCVECKTGFFIARQNGLTFTTGNCHLGYGVPIGSAFATKDIILPYAVGSDCGCGMFATKLSYIWQDLTPEIIDRIMKEIMRVIPFGTGIGHRIEQKWDGFDKAPEFPTYIQAALETARYQLGSLGAGNHFVSLLKGNDDHVWLMIHSGSRNLGANVCTEFYHRAKNFCSENNIEVPTPHLSYLPLDHEDGQWYFSMMNFALDFAKENRRRMMTVCETIACGMLGCTVDQEIDIHHNYANFEVHEDEISGIQKEVLVHRKGATPAFKGQLGIIPGSMGTSSYIVEGLGNEASLCTVSHGAGRAMSRKQAKKLFKVEDTKKLLEGIWYNHIALDEDPRCYKDINEVIKAQDDLVKPIVKLDPLGCIIGS